jgi:hypothetical protein
MFQMRPRRQEYSESMDGSVDRPSYTLVVRGPAQDLLFDHFRRLFEGRDGVVVVKDRRRGQRRRADSPVHPERRRCERRHEPPWLVPPERLA